jgi:nickel-dependent lactate racemase
MDSAKPSNNWKQLRSELPARRICFEIRPRATADDNDWPSAVADALANPIGCPPAGEIAGPASKVVILVDDLTRPTPQKRLLPPLLDELKSAGVKADNIEIIIALGTHRYMSRGEMRDRFGVETCGRVDVLNHAWRDPDTFCEIPAGEADGTVALNAAAARADTLIAVGNIVPHIWSGWGGGAKMLMPGIASSREIGPLHALAEDEPDLTRISGEAETDCRRAIEDIARRAGLDFILNVVLDRDGNPAWVGAGDPVKCHRKGAEAAGRIFLRSIQEPADVVFADARPADSNYWQGVKALAHAARGLREGGTLVLVADFPGGVAPTHPEFSEHARRTAAEIDALRWEKAIRDPVIATTLKLHATLRKRCRVICLSEGLSAEEQQALGFTPATDSRTAIEKALKGTSSGTTVGIISRAGCTVPTLRGER